MCCFFVVIKLLILKILLMALTSLTTAFHYDYGYHPSAEEFDNLLSETHRTWTQSVLKNERDNLFIKSLNRHQDSVENRARHFVPKFHYNELKKLKHLRNNPDLQKYSKPLLNIGSSLDFQHFNDELPKPLNQPTVASATSESNLDTKPQINLKPVSEPGILKYDKYSLENSDKNKTQTSFPIYFTNPATSIIYAITEIGKSTENVTTSNGTIPIFITKEQYERDILKLKNEYKQKCQNFPSSTTSRPGIITIKKPASYNFTAIKKASPVVIKKELIVKDKRPLRKKKKKSKQKYKNQKQNPGTLNTTVKPGLFNQLEGPAILLGSRIYKSKEKLSTQLEKPDIDNIFSSSVMPNISLKNHKVVKRSLEKNLSEKERRLKDENFINLGKSLGTSSSQQNDILRNFKNKTTTKSISAKTADIVLKKNSKNFLPNSQKMTQGNFTHLTNFPLKNSKNIKLRKNKEKLFEIPKFSVILKDSINEIKTKRSKHKSDFKNLDKNIFIIFISKYPKLSKTINHLKDENKHFLNKRSIEGWSNNMSSTLPQFVKGSNKFQNTTLNQREHENTAVNELKIEENQSLERKSNRIINSTEIKRNRKPFNLTLEADKNTNLTFLKMLSEVNLSNNLKINFNSTFNKGNNSQRLITTPRTINNSNKSQGAIYKKMRRKSKRKQQDTEYNFFDMGENYDDDDDDDEEEYEDDDNDEEEQEVGDEDDYKYPHKIPAYDDDPYQTPAGEISLSTEHLSESFTQETTSSSTQKDTTNRTSEIKQDHLKHPALDYQNNNHNILKPQATYLKKRTRRRPPHHKLNDDYEDYDEDDNSLSSNLGGFFRMIFYPVQMVMSSVVDSFSFDAHENDDEQNINPYTKYTSYHSMLKQHSSDDYDEDYDSNESSDYSLSNWFKSWFVFNRRNKKIGSTTTAPINTEPAKSSSWFSSWLGFGANDRIATEAASNEDYDEYDKWFASWFGKMKPKARKTTTTTTTQIPHVPILTIVDPMKNPQNWIGILAHHIINHTSTANPLKNMWNTVTTTTTENPELPRKVSYDKYQIWRLKPQDVSQVKALEEYKKSEDGIKLQWLKGPSLRGLTDVLVPPKMLVDFQASLTFELIDHEVLIFDVGKAIAYEKTKEDYFFTTTQKPKKNSVSKIPTQLNVMSWHKYYHYDDIVNYLETMRMRFPYLVELIHIGRSYEGRPLIVVKIESKEAAAVNSANYPAHQRIKLRHRKHMGLASAVFIEAGIHGMEWIAPATATWIINELLRIMKKNATDDQSFIRNTTWYIMPVLNPDGYVYSHEFDRFWKKSRSRHISRPTGILNSAMTWLQKKRVKEKICFGVDLDRNWIYQWGRRGSSKSACNDFYAGPTSFSEPETKALSDFLMDYRTQIKLFVSMQSYGQIITYPKKANKTYDSERLEDMLDVAMVGIDGLRKKGSKSRYKIDSSNDLIENRSGSSDAFAAYEAGIPFSYTLQLADNGVHGYLLPSASIESTARDSFEIIKGMLDYI